MLFLPLLLPLLSAPALDARTPIASPVTAPPNRARSSQIAAYDVVPNNRIAQILTPGSNFVSTDPWANFVY